MGGCGGSSGGGRGGGVGRGRDDEEPAAGMRDEVDVVELEDLAGAGEAPVDRGEEGVLETGELRGRKAPDACVVHIGAERVAM
jgi:hypothetical protein